MGVGGSGGRRKGSKNTAAQTEAAKDTLRRVNEKRRQTKESPDAMPRAERWRMLLDGRLTVADLDDDEISKCRVRNIDGSFTGRGQKLPSHLAQQFHQEAIKRANSKFRGALQDAVQTLADIATDPEVKESDRIKAASIIVDRVLGKAVETVRVEGASTFDEMLAEAIGVKREGLLEDESMT